MRQHIYLAAKTDDGGVLHGILKENGSFDIVERYAVKTPVWLCTDGSLLHVLLQEPFLMNSGVVSFHIRADGSLEQAGEVQSVHGTIGAHLYADQGRLWCANYINGTVVAMPNRMVAFNGCGPDPDRQTSSHPHCICPTPDGEYLCVCDLGTDRIEILTRDLTFVSSVTLPAGCGPRHMVFDGAGEFAYCATELSNTVCVLEYSHGFLKYLKSKPTLPANFVGRSAASAIRLSDNGTRLYISNRGHDSIAVFSVIESDLELLGFIPSFGRSPRDFALAGDWLLCANELSNNVQIFSLKGPALPNQPISTIDVPKPWCVLPITISAS